MAAAEIKFNTFANKLTALRIAFVPLVVLCLFDDSPRAGFLAALFFGVAAITDYFDGYYARQHKAITILGKLLDPLADKFLVVSSLIMLMHLGRLHPVVVILLVCRELAITGLRAIASAEGIVIAASDSAKWKTATQMAAIPMLMLNETYVFIPFHLIGTILIWVSLGISMWSFKAYLVDFFRTVRAEAMERREERKARKIAKRAARLKRIMAKDPTMAQAIIEAAADHGGTATDPKAPNANESTSSTVLPTTDKAIQK